MSSPDNHYNEFVAAYLDFIGPLRFSLLYGAKTILSVLGYSTNFKNDYTLALQSGEGVRMVYSCIGYGVMSFWAAFVLANKGNLKTKVLWIVGGLFLLWVINCLRVALLLLAANKHWAIPFGWDHHTWFNIIAYTFIFIMIYFYDRSHTSKNTLTLNNTANQNLQALS